MFACLISVEGRAFVVTITSYMDVTGSSSLVGSSTFKDYALEFDVPWARNLQVASLRKIVVKDSRVLQSSFEV